MFWLVKLSLPLSCVCSLWEEIKIVYKTCKMYKCLKSVFTVSLLLDSTVLHIQIENNPTQGINFNYIIISPTLARLILSTWANEQSLKMGNQTDCNLRCLQDIHLCLIPMAIKRHTALWLYCMDSDFKIFVSGSSKKECLWYPP